MAVASTGLESPGEAFSIAGADGCRMAHLRHEGFFTLPQECKRRPGNPCRKAAETFEVAVARTAGGFTRWPCFGVGPEGAGLRVERNWCYQVFTKNPGGMAAVRHAHEVAVQEAGEEWPFRSIDRKTALYQRPMKSVPEGRTPKRYRFQELET